MKIDSNNCFLIYFEKTNIISVFHLIFFIILILPSFSISGQNASANLSPDLNTSTFGNQQLVSVSPIPANETFSLDVYIKDASNLDTYEFDVVFDCGELEFVQANEDQPITLENNILKKNGGFTIGWIATVTSPGTLNIANTLIGNNAENTPDDEGLLAHIIFRTITQASGQISFQNINFFDNNGIFDNGNSISDIALPVNLLFFDGIAMSNGVKLEWETASEINNCGFNIYRSQDSLINFERMNSKMIQGQGNSTATHNYEYLDRTVLRNTNYYYYLESEDLNGTRYQYSKIRVYSRKDNIPTCYVLKQNYPNPFNGHTKIVYHIPEKIKVTLAIYNLLGELVQILISKVQEPGIYGINWNAVEITSGIYFVVLSTSKYNKTRKLILIR